jgi:hypothetical protein
MYRKWSDRGKPDPILNSIRAEIARRERRAKIVIYASVVIVIILASIVAWLTTP